MSLEDVFGSDLEDSDNEEYKASSEQAEINDLFGESGSEGEDDKQQEQTRKKRVIESDDEDEDDDDDQSNSVANQEDEDAEEKVGSLCNSQ